MKVNPYEMGRVVVSRQGHDHGRRFLVVGLVDERFVLIADGDTRKLDHPKKKQLKHLYAEPYIAQEALASIAAHQQTADSDIRKALKATAPTQPQSPKRADRITSKEEFALVQE